MEQASTRPKSPRISILIPCYQQARFLPEALDSVLHQDFQDLEVIASDDASSDNTFSILQDYAVRDSRIHIFRQSTNLGMVENWNFCLWQARGEAVKLMGGDDRLDRSDCLSLEWAALQRPGLALVSSARQLIDEAGEPIRIESTFSPGLHTGAAARDRMLETQTNLVGEPVCALFWRNLSSRGFDPTYRQLNDMEFWFHLLTQGDLLYQHEPLVSFRMHPRQQSEQNWKSGLSSEEHVRLLLQEASKPSCGRKARRAVALWTWGMLPHLPRSSALNLMESAQRLRSQLGHVRFWFAATGHLLRRLAGRWERSIRKRIGQRNT